MKTTILSLVASWLATTSHALESGNRATSQRTLNDDLTTDLLITGVIDGPLTGGVPKAIEIYALADVPDLSIYGVGSANNGGGTDGQEFDFPADSVAEGAYLYVALESSGFEAFFGFAPTYTDSAASINGDDAIELFKDGHVVDTFGQIDVDGTNEPWEYLDGWAYRTCTSSGTPTFDISQWFFSGTNVLDGTETNDNENPFPIGTFCGTTTSTTPATTTAPPEVKIHEIQGDGDSTPLNEVKVQVEAIVVGVFQSGLGGFFIQEEDIDVDGNEATSEGIFVFDGFGRFGQVSLGDKVIVVGEVRERFDQTQINAELVSLVSGGNPLPTPASITLDPTGEMPTNLEPYEGMLVLFDQKMTLVEQFQLQRFAEVRFAAGERPVQFTQTNEPNADEFAVFQEQLSNRLLILDDGADGSNNYPITTFANDYSTATAPRMGDFTNGLKGVLRYSFGAFRLIAVAEGDIALSGNPRPAGPPDVGGTHKIATFNVLNFFTTLDDGSVTRNGSGPRGARSEGEYERQLQKLVTTILEADADIFGLIEIENDFLQPNSTIQILIDEVNVAIGSQEYAYVHPPEEFVGGDAIAVAFIYKTSTIVEVGNAAILDFEDDKTRSAVAQSFQAVGGDTCFTLTVNHFKSKGSACDGDGEREEDGAGNCNEIRSIAANKLLEWLSSNPTTSNCGWRQAILGDLNSYRMEDPIKILADGLPDKPKGIFKKTTFSNPIDPESYGYIFDGQIGTLDYILINAPFEKIFAGSAEWNINADEASALDYFLRFDRDPDIFDGTVPFRSSDHDLVLAGVNLLK
uniref:Endonuclease/exonuclease/phosphatase domain-containing protein n=1 Tax=Amphora coffeiformis TaxID=265554 RepID=A0A7S3L3L9_9STRA